MRTLLIATQKGDERLAIAKFLAVFIVIGLCSLLSSAIEYGYFDLKYGLPHGDYLYYINQDDQGYLYRYNLTTRISELLVPIYGHKVYIIANYPFVYYRTFDIPTGASDTYRIAKETLQFEVIEALSQSTLP